MLPDNSMIYDCNSTAGRTSDIYVLIVPLLIGILIGIVILILVYYWNIRTRRLAASAVAALEPISAGDGRRYGQFKSSKLASYRPRYNNRAFHSFNDVYGRI